MAAENLTLERLGASARRVGRRLSALRRPLFLLAAAFLALVLFARLPALAALVGYLAAALIVVDAAGNDEEEGDGQPFGRRDEREQKSRQRDFETWRAIADAVPEGAVVLDSDGNVLHHNALAPELFPRIRVGQALSLTTRNPELNEAIEKAYAEREQVKVQVFERVPVERRIEAVVAPLVGLRGGRASPRLLVTFRDLTAEDRLAQMRADFIANASHELRTPLASLRGFVETLQGPARDDPKAREKFLGIMASQAARMTRLIDDLLSLSRVEMRAHLPPKSIIDLNEVAAYVAQSLEPVAEAAKISISVEKLDTPARIRGDRDEIVQLIQNLVHNGIKYGHEGGSVTIRLGRVIDGQPPGPRLLLAITDDGPGISPEHLPRLTERFYRANVNASREKGGTGLGLAIVKHIVLRHRGDMRISSELGHGSTFSVLFEEAGGSRPL